MVYSRLLPVVVVVSKRAHVWEFPQLFSLASVLKIIFNPSSSTEKAWTGSLSVRSVVASTFLQDLSGHRLEIHSAGGDRSWNKSGAALQGCQDMCKRSQCSAVFY